MSGPLQLRPETRCLLRCPVCYSELHESKETLECLNPECRQSYPIFKGAPVLINEQRSLFSKREVVTRTETYARAASRFQRALDAVLPDISRNVKARENFRLLESLLLKQNPNPRVLVLGGRVAGSGMAGILSNPDIEFVETDVVWGPRTRLICDAHDIPFADGSFHAVIAQAVLESVLDPYECAAQIHRVLAAGGLVYADTPFMQQVHAGRYDFTRFTCLGHRHLFKQFEEISSGATCGPGMALAWSIQYFMLSFVRTARSRRAVRVLSRLGLFWLKYFDSFLVDRPGALDGASGVFFLGRKSDRALPDRDLIQGYRGIM